MSPPSYPPSPPLGSKRSRSDSLPGSVQSMKRNRQSLNCAECRRLKMKCDRQVPCGGCCKRGCAYLCPEGTMASMKERRDEQHQLNKRIKVLESALQTRGQDVPAESPSSSSHPPPTPSSKPFLAWGSSTILPPSLHSSEGDETSSSEVSPGDSQISAARHEAPRPTPLASWPTNASRSMPSTVPPPAPVVHRRRTRREGEIPNPIESSGTLVLNSSGRVRFIGPSAGSQWLREGAQEAEESHPPSPFRDTSPYGARDIEPSDLPSLFPFTGTANITSYKGARRELPSEEEARVLVDSYYRHVGWNDTPILRATFIDIVKSIYRDDETADSPKLAYHKLGLVMIVLAVGTLLNLEIPPHDPSAERYYQLSKTCLAMGDFLHHNTLVSVQALYIMAEYLSYAEQGEGGDLAWPVWGIATRIMQAMGLHRDGERWNLSPQELDDRRRIFWECHTTDVFQSNCWGRPNAISPEQFDVKFPIDLEAVGGSTKGSSAPGFHTLKYSFSGLSKEVLDEALRITPSPYEKVKQIWHKIVQFENDIPFHLRCRASMEAMASRYANPAAAESASPPPSKKDLRLTFQQHALALCCCEGVLFLLRSYFTRALYESPDDPLNTQYGEAYLAIIERCNMIIALVRSLHSLFPSITARHWFFWVHIFSAAVCLSMVIIVSPTSPLAKLALSELESVISLFTQVNTVQAGRRMRMNLRWLQRLRTQALHKMNSAASHRGHPPAENVSQEDAALHVGWRTRLIQQGEHRAKDVASSMQAQGFVVPQLPQPGHMANSLPLEEDGADLFNNLDFDSADFLEQLLAVPVSHSFPLQAGDSFVGHASLLGPTGVFDPLAGMGDMTDLTRWGYQDGRM